jgi:ABC-2 type transport system permease protein
MLDTLALYGRYLGISARAQMQYRASFLLASAGQLAVTGIEFLGVMALFDRFGGLPDWRLEEVAVFYGTVNVAFALADSLCAGFDRFGELVREGDLDRMLLRPRSAVLQLVGYEISLRRVGRLLQGAFVLSWGAASVGVEWSATSAALLGAAIAGGACLFLGLFVVQATIAFWTTETLELVSSVTYGGVYTAQYPLSIYSEGLRRFFTYVVPLAAIAYFPVVAILGRPDPLGSPLWFQRASPLLGVAFLLATLGLWRLGLRRYTSTGS